jgi:hypothetical protein
MIWQGQRVKTLGRRNAKPTATERSWKTTSNTSSRQRTPPIENGAGEIPGMEIQV